MRQQHCTSGSGNETLKVCVTKLALWCHICTKVEYCLRSDSLLHQPVVLEQGEWWGQFTQLTVADSVAVHLDCFETES